MKNVILFVLFVGIKSIIVSQTISCSNFSITGSYPDTINLNDYQISINFNSDPNEIVGYPHVSAVLDCNGDTVATGGLFYFGQLGQTTQDYPVTISNNSSWCEPLTAVFIYGSGSLNESDTCSLVFQSATIANNFKTEKIAIYFNLASSELSFLGYSTKLKGQLTILNSMGNVVWEGEYQSKIKFESYPNGLYFLNLSDGLSNVSKRFLKVN
jgi:hypothetical protein